jgi:uncharacterized protein
MMTDTRSLDGATPGQRFEISFLHFGQRGARPKVYIQAGLHADEAPGQLVAHHLRGHLAKLDAEGAIRGHVVLVPTANPIGLSQQVHGTLHGRFALHDGCNFNRGYPDLAAEVGEILSTMLTDDGDTNVRAVRGAMRAALVNRKPVRPVDRLRHMLLEQAIEADIVLDLHCDGEAEVHLYTSPEGAEVFGPLAAYLDAKAVLVADVSGDNPFDEAVSGPWRMMRERFPDRSIPQGAVATTVELRGEADVDHVTAERDAGAILDFLAHRGVIARAVRSMPPLNCRPTPLAGSEALEAPASGLIVYCCPLGRAVEPGTLIAEIIDPVSGRTAPVHTATSGIFYARTSARFAVAGRRLGKIAGTTPFRSGNLLSP